MMTESKKYKVVIGGETYTIVSDEPEHQLMKAVAAVDSFLQANACNTKAPNDQKKLAVLAALTMASKYVASEAALEQVNSTKEELLKRIECEVFPNRTCS